MKVNSFQINRTNPLHPSFVRLSGLLCYRFQSNRRNRLLVVSDNDLLSAFKHRPGSQAWVGEHIGKWLHAAVLTYSNSTDAYLKAKIDNIVQQLISTQDQDGYLGTYNYSTRWSMDKEHGWDVWVHKYVLIGLLTYHQFMAEDKLALQSACKIADLLVSTFGNKAMQLDLMERSTHVGMASSSILQPMVWLYRTTGERRYFDFCRYIVWAWEHSPCGPKLLSNLSSHGDVSRTANGKAYEMMSCLIGGLELYRILETEGSYDEANPLLLIAQRAWDDITEKRMYLTGGTSYAEHFQPDFHLPNEGEVSETCATVTFLQLTLDLFYLTGEAKYIDIAERIVFNHLLSAQHPDGDRWCYFTPLEGTKIYRADINCCSSSGPRAIAILPTFIYTQDDDFSIRVNLYTKSVLNFPEQGIRIMQETDYPYGESVTFRVEVKNPTEFALRLRIPRWCDKSEVMLNSKTLPQPESGSYCEIKRSWSNGDTVHLTLEMPLKVLFGTHTNEGKLAIMKGPLILAVDERFLPPKFGLKNIKLPTRTKATLPILSSSRSSNSGKFWDGQLIFETSGVLYTPQKTPTDFPLKLTDFMHAGANGSLFTVWLQR